MRQIEHKIISCFRDKIEDHLKKMEVDGWELATIFDSKHENEKDPEVTYYLVFKRKS